MIGDFRSETIIRHVLISTAILLVCCKNFDSAELLYRLLMRRRTWATGIFVVSVTILDAPILVLLSLTTGICSSTSFLLHREMTLILLLAFHVKFTPHRSLLGHVAIITCCLSYSGGGSVVLELPWVVRRENWLFADDLLLLLILLWCFRRWCSSSFNKLLTFLLRCFELALWLLL